MSPSSPTDSTALELTHGGEVTASTLAPGHAGYLDTLAEVHFLSDGGHGSNVLVSQTAGKLVLQGQRYTPDGKPSWGSTEMINLNENNWTAQFVRISFGGASVPDSPKFNFTRVK
jgi:hypothetical protein